MTIFSYLFTHINQVGTLFFEHIQLTTLAVLLAITIGVPIGILISYVKNLHKPMMSLINFIQAIPSMALLGFAIPLLGIGTLPAVVVVLLYSLLPIVKNTYIGITQINPATIEAARGIGMTKKQILTKIQLPMTLPVLMGGVRISAVNAVGLITIAAFIGAGGLGFLVFSGISSVSTGMIIAGALPACILALFLDWILSLVEDLVTPLSLHKENLKNKAKVKKQLHYKRIVVGATCFALAGIMGISAFNYAVPNTTRIVIGGKQFTEQYILVDLMKELIESKTNLKVETKQGTGGTQVLFSALQKDEIDMYIEYTGTAYVDILKHHPTTDEDKVLSTIHTELPARYQIQALNPAKFNNTYTLAVPQDIATRYQLNTMSDLAAISPSVKAGLSLEFMNRKDGLTGISNTYGIHFKDTVGIDGATRYMSLTNGETQVVDAFATDGLLKKFKLKVLKDDKHFFPNYYGIPLIRSETLAAHPELSNILDDLLNSLDDETMQNLNYEVDENGRASKDVAHEFLVTHHLL